MKKLIAALGLVLGLLHSEAQAQTCPYIPPTTWYWSIQDTLPGLQVWNGDTGAYVVLADATYVAWLAQGCLPTSIDTENNLLSTLNSYASGIGRVPYQSYNNSDATTQMTNPVSPYVNAGLTNATPILVLPQQNLPTSMRLGQPTLIRASGSFGFPIEIRKFGGTIPVITVNDSETAVVVPIDNQTPEGSFASYILPRLTPTNASNLTTGTVACARLPSLTGDITSSSCATTLASIIAASTAGNATTTPVITWDAKGRLTAVSSATITPAVGSITGLGTNVATALAIAVGSAGSPVTFNGALGTPSSGVGTNITNVNAATLGGATFAAPGAIGGGTAAAGTFTTLTGTAVSGTSFALSGNISAAAWTTNGIRYKNVAGTLTDTTSSGTVAAAYTNVYGGSTIASSSATTFTNYFNTYFNDPVVGTNVTMTNKWAMGADSAKFGTSNQLTISAAGILTAIAPVLGTPASVTLTNATGLPISTGVSGLGTGVGTFLGTPSSANLLAAVTDETGTGPLVFGTSPTLTTAVAAGTWTASGTWTLPAHTLGGTVSGGGNQINNVIIGTTTPLAGSFTTLKASTSVTAGSATAGPYAFNVNKNTGAIPSNPAAIGAQITGAFSQVDGTPNRVGIFSAGTGVYSTMSYFTSRGTLASPTATQSGDTLGSNFWNGYGTSDYAAGAGFVINATQNWTSDVALGSKIDIYTAPNGSTIAISATFNQSGGVSIGSATDPGIGGLQVNGQQFNPNMAADTATPDSTMCTATTGGKILKGTGTLGICLGTSGAQFKTAFGPMRSGLAEIAKINLQTYRYIPGHGDGGGRVMYGPTAQDVEKVLPDLAGHDANGETINYDSGALFFIGLRAIQELKSANDNLRAEVDELKRNVTR